MRAIAWAAVIGLLTFLSVFAFTVPTHGVGSCASGVAGAAGNGCTSTEYTFLGREVSNTWTTADALRVSLLAAVGVALVTALVVLAVAARSSDG